MNFEYADEELKLMHNLIYKLKNFKYKSPSTFARCKDDLEALEKHVASSRDKLECFIKDNNKKMQEYCHSIIDPYLTKEGWRTLSPEKQEKIKKLLLEDEHEPKEASNEQSY